jgi:outer membrane protein OmpA-like peptidoglycan-associated protein/Tol biopolymer transport system component
MFLYRIFLKYFILFVVTVFLFVFTGNLFAQDDEDGCPEVDKKARKTFESAQESFKKGNPDLGYKLLIETVKIEEGYAAAYLMLADINNSRSERTNDASQSLQYRNRSIEYFKKAAEYCPSIDNYRASYEVGKRYYISKDFKNAQLYIDKFIANSKQSQFKPEAESIIKRIKTYNELMSKPVPFNPIKVKGLNTLDDEFLPLISPDGDIAFFTHRYNKKSDLGNVQRVDEFTMADRTSKLSSMEEIFGNIKSMSTPFNDKNNSQGAISVTIDNNHLYLTICENNQFCDIWVSDYEDGEWTALKNMGAAINGRRSWESQPSISSDGKTLYFSSIRPGNQGFDLDDQSSQTSDIWMAKLGDDGIWKPAVNLGNVINSHGNEKSPFIHSDSQTLYFSSDGLDGIGGYDIYFSKMKADGKWTEPKNIGYPINTEGDELGFIVSTFGKKAYFSSNKLQGSEGWDIYSFDLYEEARPKEIAIVKGEIKNSEGEAIQDAKVEIKDVKTNRVTEGMVDKMTGKYAVAISVDIPDAELIMTVKKKEYAFTSEYIKVKEIKKEEAVKVNFEVKPVEVGATVKLNNIYFSFAEAVFEKSTLVVLDNFLEYLQENPQIKISIYGHTDNDGKDETNQALSEKRAKAVSEYLVLMGLDKSRIVSARGYGETKPIATNETAEGRALNRRTEFVIEAK